MLFLERAKILTHVPYVLAFLRAFVSYVPSFFYVPYVPSFFSCLTWLPLFTCITCLYLLRLLRAFIFVRALLPFTFLSCSNFWRFSRHFTFFKEVWNNQNQPQQAGISKSKVEQTKNCLNKLKQPRTLLENYF